MSQDSLSFFSRLCCLPVLALPLVAGLGMAGTAQAQYHGDDRYYQDDRGGAVRCESVDRRTRECPLDGRPRLVRQVSGTPCVEGQSWGSTRNGVWVSNGCRAEFVGERRGRPSRPGHGHGNGWGGSQGGNGWGGSQGGNGWGGNDSARVQLIDCDSNDRRQRRCGVTIRQDARLVRQKSGTPCVEGETWGWNRDGIWVSNGCRAQFQVR